MIKECKIEKADIVLDTTSIIDVAKTLEKLKKRSVIVVNAGQEPVGIISAVDICNKIVAAGKDPKSASAKEVMNSPIDAVSLEQEEEFALKIMMERNTFSCPVIEGKKLVGTVNYGDIFSKVCKNIQGE